MQNDMMTRTPRVVEPRDESKAFVEFHGCPRRWEPDSESHGDL
jgi:hypothetical protein